MGLLRDWTFVEEATRIPALSELVREALIRAMFVRDDRALPAGIVGALSQSPSVTVKVKDDVEVRKLVRVLNGEESTMSLGLSAEDFHYFRKQVGIGRDREIGLAAEPRDLLAYDWIVPEQGGVLLDFGAYAAVEFAEGGHRALAQVGMTWKALYDEALAKGHFLPFVPAVPLDFALGDGLWGDAPFTSFAGDFGAYVLGLRTINAYGERARVGFEDVSVEGSGYDLLHAILPYATEFFMPVSVGVRLAARPAARKTLSYTFDDPGKLSAAVDKLTRSGRTVAWAQVADALGGSALRPGGAAPFTLQVSVPASDPAGLAAREKGLDATLTGFAGKADLPDPYDVPADAYRKTAARVARGLFVGEVRLPARALGDLQGKVQGIAGQAGVKAGLLASLRADGTASAFPFFEAQKDRVRVYELSKGVHRVAKTVPAAAFVSRLAHLWEDSADYRVRMDHLRRLKLEIDAAHVLEPLAHP